MIKTAAVTVFSQQTSLILPSSNSALILLDLETSFSISLLSPASRYVCFLSLKSLSPFRLTTSVSNLSVRISGGHIFFFHWLLPFSIVWLRVSPSLSLSLFYWTVPVPGGMRALSAWWSPLIFLNDAASVSVNSLLHGLISGAVFLSDASQSRKKKEKTSNKSFCD